MTTMRLARRTRSAVTNCDRCAERSTPWRAAAATASGGGGRPGPSKPAESTRTPFRADARRSRAAAARLPGPEPEVLVFVPSQRAVGAETVPVCVLVLEPPASVTVSVTLYVPATV